MESVSLIFKVLWAPGEAMSRVSKSKKMLLPMVLLTVAGIVSVWVIFTYLNIGELTVRAAEQSGRVKNLTSEQRTQMLSAVNSPMAKDLAAVIAIVGPILTILVVTVVYFGLFTLIGREAGFQAFFAVTAFAFVPSLIRSITAIVTVLVVPQSQIMLDEIGNIGPVVFLDRTAVSKYVFAAVSQVDVISFWILILLVIGYRFLLRKSVSPAVRFFGVFAIWGVYVACRIALA